MAGQIPRHFIDDLLGRVDIVEVIGQRIKLKKSGSNHSACCPFHNEKTPSFTVSETKQFYHCFGCGAHGNAISFLIEYDNMHFIDAIETLAGIVGVEVPREATETTPQRQQAQSLYELLQQCAQYYQQQLKTSTEAIDYLKQRGLSGEIAATFGLGYAPGGWHTLEKLLPGQNDQLLSAGMLTRNDSGKVYDRFRERIMFPIRDRRGRVIGFGGRVMDNTEPKYLNSPETPVFHKGSELYGVHEGRKAMLDDGQVIVVEGYMDVIALAQRGVANAVATLGTATNRQHAEQLYRIVPEIVFCFDGDRAGRDAAWRALQATLPALKDGRDAFFLFLPDGEDPDSVVRQQGGDGFRHLLAGKISAVDFLCEFLTGNADLEQIGVRARLAEQARPLVELIPAGVYRQLAAQKIEKLVGVSLQLNTATDVVQTTPTPRHNERTRSVLTSAIQLLLQMPSLAAKLDPESYSLNAEQPGVDVLLKLIDYCDSDTTVTTGTLIERFRDSAQFKRISELAVAHLFPDGRELDDEQALALLKDCLDKLSRFGEQREADKVSPSDQIGLLSIRRSVR